LLNLKAIDYLLGFFILLLLIIIYVLYVSLMKVVKSLGPQASKEVAEKNKVVEVNQGSTSFWKWIDSKVLTRAVPVEQETDILLDHDYDGIRELDNNLPPWWKWGFYITIVFAFVYLFNYHFAAGKNQLQEYNDELTAAVEEKAERLKDAANNITEENVVALTDESSISAGKENFTKLCVACHLNDGGGQVGPNLTDSYWLHGGGIKNIFRTISEGVPSKGMISWKNQLSPKQVQELASFIVTLKGTRPAVPKEPQGDLWQEEVQQVKDTLSAGKSISAK
jgi:cytochrome c oxidase cbb3-type subunit III